jgi:hypothetical protein
MSYTAGELEAFDPPLASHSDSAEENRITPFSIHDPTRQKYPEQNHQRRIVPHEISNLSTIMAKAGLEERVERVCAACSPSAPISWLNSPLHHVLLPANKNSSPSQSECMHS